MHLIREYGDVKAHICKNTQGNTSEALCGKMVRRWTHPLDRSERIYPKSIAEICGHCRNNKAAQAFLAELKLPEAPPKPPVLDTTVKIVLRVPNGAPVAEVIEKLEAAITELRKYVDSAAKAEITFRGS